MSDDQEPHGGKSDRGESHGRTRPAASPRGQKPRQWPVRILIIDDDNDFSESFQLMLMTMGHSVLPAPRGEDGILKYVEFAPDIVFLDVKMPGLDGYETFLRIKKIDPAAKIVFMSSYMLDDDRYQQAKQNALAGLVNKPIEPAALKRMIRRYAKRDP